MGQPLPDVLRLALCVIGVVGSLLVYGILQVRGQGDDVDDFVE